MKSKIKVVIVDDQKLIRQGIVSLFDDQEHIELLKEASSGQEIIKWFSENETSKEVDVVLMDMQMPGMEGWEVTKKLIGKNKNLKIIALSSYDNESFIERFISCGGRGYLLKNQTFNEIVTAINEVVEMGFYFSEHVQLSNMEDFFKMNRIYPNFDTNELSAREIEIIQLICEQKTTQEIADELFLSKKTIESHKDRIMVKTNSKNIVGIALYAVKTKLVILK